MMLGEMLDFPATIPSMLQRGAGRPSSLADARLLSTPAASEVRTPEALASSGAFAFRAICQDFDEALAAAPDETVVFSRRMAAHVVRYRCVGRKLAEQVARSIDHLPVVDAAVPPELSIDFWDEHATGVACSIRPDDPSLGPFGKVLYSSDSRYMTYQRPEFTSWYDRRTARIIAWYRSADRVYLDQRAKPFKAHIFEWLRDRGVILIHAGLLSRGEIGVLMVGRSGSGKSTTSLACLAAGFDFLSDDFVGLQELPDGTFCGHSLFATSVLDREHLARFPAFRPDAEPTAHEHEHKSFLPLVQRYRQQLSLMAEPHLVLLPRVVDSPHTSYRPASKVDALLALAPPSLLSMPRPRRETFALFCRLVEQLPAFWLELGRDIDAIPCVVDQIIDREVP